MSIASNLATNYRYEIVLHPPSYFYNRMRLQEYIEEERQYNKSISEQRWYARAKLLLDHAEQSEGPIQYKFRVRGNKIVKKEYQWENKALILVRRAAMRHLLELDHKQYDAELRAQGKAVYIKRL